MSQAARTPARRARSPQFAHAARVAVAATVLIGVVYLGCAVVLDQVVAARLVAAVDSRLGERLADALAGPGREPGPRPGLARGQGRSGPVMAGRAAARRRTSYRSSSGAPARDTPRWR